ncbi:sensor histidine kinase [Falsiroseomonas bella]|nr:HAMP domain-containing sensor histidine kinase [Falsiroseomonas bella]
MQRETPEGGSWMNVPADPGAPLDSAAALAGAVAHDLGNMLTVVLGNAELLVEGLADRPELLEFATLILGAAQRGTELTARLDRFARPLREAAGPTDAAAALQAFGRRLAYSLPPEIRLDLAIAPDLPAIALAEPALVGILDELVSNALAAMRGKGCLQIRAENHFLSHKSPRIVIVVQDDGPGMARETLRRATTARFTAGVAGHKTAIGLALAMRVVLAAGGRLQIASNPGEGTRVSLDLPSIS